MPNAFFAALPATYIPNQAPGMSDFGKVVFLTDSIYYRAGDTIHVHISNENLVIVP